MRSSKCFPTLSVTVITRPVSFTGQPEPAVIDGMNPGRINPGNISWDQPHDGNPFHYRRRSLECGSS
jgi:hypothetical protein